MVNTYTRIISTGFHSRGPRAALDYSTLTKTSTSTTTTTTITGRGTEAAPNPSPEKEEGSSTELNVRRSIPPVGTFLYAYTHVLHCTAHKGSEGGKNTKKGIKSCRSR